jgi:hypothetical protein
MWSRHDKTGDESSRLILDLAESPPGEPVIGFEVIPVITTGDELFMPIFAVFWCGFCAM